MRDIGKNIKDLREKKGLTQDELAELLFVTRQTVSNYENGRSRPDIDMLMRISQALEADVNHLLYGTPGQTGRQKALRRLAVAGVGIVALFLLCTVAIPMMYRAVEHRYIVSPHYFLGPLVSPAFFLLLGWALAQGVCLFPEVKINFRPWFPWVRLILAAFLLLTFLPLLPWCIWGFSCWLKVLTQGYCSSSFPMSPIYQSVIRFLLDINTRHPAIYTIPGSIWCLLGFPAVKTSNENKTAV